MRLARNRGLEVVTGRADRQAGGRIADDFEVFEVAVRVTGLTFGGRADYGGDVVVTLDVCLRRELPVTAVRLGLAGERGFQMLFGLAAFQAHDGPPIAF